MSITAFQRYAKRSTSSEIIQTGLGDEWGAKCVDLELRGTLASVAVLVAIPVLLKGCFLVPTDRRIVQIRYLA